MSRVLYKFNPHELLIARKFPIHDHLLYSTTEHGSCAGCFEENDLSAEFYECLECNIFFHKECIESAIEINHPFHPQHSLGLVNRDNVPNKSDQKCSLCKEELKLLVYCCCTCDFKLGMSCAKIQPLFQIDQRKVHEHVLHLLLKNVFFICDACGLEGDRSPYLCVTCSFMFHIHCVYFPHESRRINVHDDVGKVGAINDKPNDEFIKIVELDKKGNGIAHILVHKDDKADEIGTIYDSSKFGQILQNYSKPIELDHIFECLPNNLRQSSVRANEEKFNDEPIKVVKLDERGKGIAHFTHEHQPVFHMDVKVDDVNTSYDSCKFNQILQNYRKPIDLDRLLECLPNNFRPSSDGEGSNEKSHDPYHESRENTIFTIPTIIISMVLPQLHDLAQQMVQAGHQQQLLKTYRDIRGAVMEQSLQKLGVERFRKKDVQKMKWDILEAKAVNWIHYMRISVKMLFAMEKKISDQIFDGVESLKEQSFAEVTANSFAMLLSFGDAFVRSKKSPEKLFVLLDMYNIMRELQPEFELIFGSKPCTEMKESALYMTKIIAQTAQDTFVGFEEVVEKDANQTVVIDGSVHPLTSYVVNYVKYLFEYHSSLRLVLQEFDSKNPDFELKSVTTRILQALETNLDGKSKKYKDAALTQLFLMNNIHYMVRSVRRSKEKNLLGDDWVQKRRRIVQRHANQYKRLSWTKILQCLNIHLSGRGSIEYPSITKTLVKERFKNFNSQFEELHQRRCQWSVPDVTLRESLRLAVSKVILPAFRSFLKRFGPIIEGCKNPQKYIKFSPEDLERMLNEFFEGKNLE